MTTKKKMAFSTCDSINNDDRVTATCTSVDWKKSDVRYFQLFDKNYTNEIVVSTMSEEPSYKPILSN